MRKSRTLRVGMSLACVLMVGASRQAYAQDKTSTPAHVSVGGFWSANVASVALNPSPGDVKSRQWEGGGATVDVPLSGILSIDARAMWNRKGARLPIAGTSAFQDVSADYLSFPVLVKASMRGAVRPYLVGGAEFAVRTRARIRTVLGALESEQDASSLVRRSDVSLDFGAGVERTLAKSRLFVEGLYAHGLRNVTPDRANTDSTRTRTFSLLAGLRF
jgi:Outer membrane protein beta-barrel domain